MSDIGKIIRVNALPSPDKRENNVIYQVAAPGAATYKDYAIDSSGDLKTPSYIPLTGTEEGKPLTKNIEVDPSEEGSVGLISNTPDVSEAVLVIQENDSILAESSNSAENNSSSIHIHYDDGIEISATTSDEQFSAIIDTSGLKGDHYAPPTSDEHYVQKKYVDDTIALENLASIVNRDNYTPKPIYFVNGDEEFTSLGMNQNTYSYFWGNMNPNHTGDANISIGYYSMGNMTTGEFNVSVGISSLQNLTTGTSNSSFGSYTLQGLTTGYKNVAFGRGAGAGMSTGNLNTLIGYKANNSVNFGDKNIFLGAHSAQGVTGSNNIIIGVGAGVNGGALNNKLIIHSNHTLSGYSSSSSQEGTFATPQLSYLENALISGDFVERLVTFNINSLAIRQAGNANTAINITPNSGAGITSAIQHTPTNHKDFVQKKYVDDKWQEFIIFDTGPTIDIAPEALNIDVTTTVMGSSSSVNITNGLKPMQRFTLMNLGDSDLSFQLNGYTVGTSLSPYTKRVYIVTNNGTGLVSSQDQALSVHF